MLLNVINTTKLGFEFCCLHEPVDLHIIRHCFLVTTFGALLYGLLRAPFSHANRPKLRVWYVFTKWN
jgi:hypothetical protein